MYLKSIDIQGFKSFANKIRFDFHNGITGIVGPNGSGKSNVADAVRWVFGEQSAKQLRGSSMQDVIFAGTQIRKPQSYAAVSITLDNSDRALAMDYDTVTVTRKVYRSGESEYILNDNQCRLRDIQELFYDTGIGKDGYSIIGQGQIDKILSGKAEDRRELFDEAAGIVKFKKRKAVALKKLENERQNMVRLTDIMSELEKQVGPLARQSDTAQQYLKLRDELRIYELNAFLLDSEIYTADLNRIAENLTNILAEIAEKTEKEEQLKQQYADVDETMRALDERIEALHNEMLEAGDRRNELEAEIASINNEKSTEENNLGHNETRCAEIASEIEAREASIEKTLAERNTLSSDLYEAENSAAVLRLGISELSAKESAYRGLMEDEQGKYIDLLNEKSEIAAKLQHLTTLIEQNGLRAEELRTEIGNIENKAKEVVSAIDEQEAKIKAHEEGSAQLRAELSESESRTEDAEDAYRKAQRAAQEHQEKMQIRRSRYDALKNLAERYEGYNTAVRRLMDSRKQMPGIVGVVADLFQVDPRFETAVETALGGAVQNVVTESETAAKRAVQFLKENKAGRATFLPLDSIKPFGNQKERGVVKEPGVIDTADRLVQTDPKYEIVVRFLLERFVVVDHIDNALKLANKYRHSLRIVTLDGELLQVGGAITGGAYRNTSNLLGRNQELDQLEKQIAKDRSLSEELLREVNRRKQELDSDTLETEDIREELHEREVESASFAAELDSRRRELTMLTLEKKENESRLRETEEERQKAEGEHRAIREAAAKIEEAGTASTDSTTETKKLLEEVQALLQEKQKEAEELNLKIAGINQKEQFLGENIERFYEEINRLKEDRTRLENASEEARAHIEAFEESIRTLREEITQEGSALGSLDEEYQSLGREREEKQKVQHAYFEKRDELSTELSALTKEQLRLESQQEKLEERLDNETEHLWTEYEISPSEAEAYRRDDLTNAPAVRRRASELRGSIRALGNVNVNAIEQYKEVSERYEFMKTQYEDLKKAEADLDGIVQELDEGMRKQFSEKFAEIRREFNAVFTELFGGGQGTIELEKDEDIIDADISVISQPPGKKLQNMLQLSGGEKALTAIALIFAIQNLKPSPFCLLDEIEAALDEPNVGRFTGYLKKLTKNTQFIVITHRRGTMVAADRLYGITMQEKGVSALVSVNLVDRELDN